MKMVAAAAMPVWLTFPCQGLGGRTPGLQFHRGNKEMVQRRCTRKARPTTISAIFELKPPPYQLNALEPHMSRDTLEYHWGKHHRTYVENLNKQIAGTELDGMSLEDVIISSYNRGDILPAFNNAAQAWNHDFFWESMKPGGGGSPSGDLLELIERDFGSFERFLSEFKSAASTQFGSGWAWLCYKANRLDVDNAVNPLPSDEDKKLVVVKSPNAANPLVWDYSPLLTIDVWEHAYYLDYQNRRPDYISVFMDKLVSWEAVSYRLEIAKARAAEREMEEERRKREEEDEQESDGEAVEMYLDSDADDSEAD
ncbi:hypothetical protein ACOSQ2_000236 [Xanthoceras sorbifolium]|uniref:superoxide dismutase n=1 Tax=Xanthoceras sorbifolium TaxID=99658 RepID=A0ABQ8GY72_9ROSI|nr:hypothetical protein JRO89_XSUnG0156000 [Xanthoceras sorbifolium]